MDSIVVPVGGSNEVTPTNGAAVAQPPCPFNDLPENLHQYIHATESRIAKLESDRDRFEQALLNVGKFIFDSPMSKMMLSALPKEAQHKLRSYFGNSDAK
jgi:hypothetical protein